MLSSNFLLIAFSIIFLIFKKERNFFYTHKRNEKNFHCRNFALFSLLIKKGFQMKPTETIMESKNRVYRLVLTGGKFIEALNCLNKFYLGKNFLHLRKNHAVFVSHLFLELPCLTYCLSRFFSLVCDLRRQICIYLKKCSLTSSMCFAGVYW